MINRQITAKILSLSKKFPAIVVNGPRQSGKTTLIRNIFPEHQYRSLEEPDVRLQAENDPRSFIKNAGDRFIIDEVQRVPELFSYLQTYLDSKTTKGSVILSGSQSFLLNEKITQSLAGRVAMFKLLPFSYQELSDVGINGEQYEEQIVKGFYPGIYSNNISPPDFYPNYIETYVERDVRQLKNIGDLNQFVRFLKLCAGRAGQILNLSSLATDADISVNTVKNWLSVLVASYVLFFLHPYYKNFNKRLIKMPKLYFFDTGLVCSLLNIRTDEQLSNFYLKSNIFENYAVLEIIKSLYNRGIQQDLYYWRESRGNEVDVIMEQAGHEIPVEIKMSLTLNADHFKGIDYFKKLSGYNKAGAVIYTGEDNLEYSNNRYISWRRIAGFVEKFPA